MPNENDKLLLLSCCAPCSVGVLTRLKEAGKNVSVLFYNPNIRPQAEYEKRRDENKRICEKMGIAFIELPYDPETWNKATQGLEKEPERGKRCDVCFKLRLLAAAKYAKENDFPVFSSVLGISRHKDFDQVCRAAQKASEETGIPYDATNWRLNGGEQLRAELTRALGLYAQNYCGCKPRPSCLE